MNKQEAIEKIDRVLSSPRSIGGYPYDYEDGLRYAKDIINQIDEPERPVIPKFVARAIETHKALGKSLHSLSYLTNNKEYNEWLRSDMKIKPERFEMVARAWLDGYEVEKEKLYTARLKLITISYVNYINKRSDGAIVLSDLNAASGNYQTSFSRSELEQLNVWDNPVFEIKEADNEMD